MPRPYTDIALIKQDQPIKNGAGIVTTTFLGNHGILETYTKNTPVISDIQSKYGYRFYNGIFVQIIGDQALVGG